MLQLHPGLIVWTILTFLVVLVVLRAAAWKPLLQSLRSREEHIRASLEKAEEAEREARRLLDEHRQQMQRAEAESARVIREGRELGERLKAEILEKARQSSRHMVDQAKDEIEREKESALVHLRAEAADLIIDVAGKLIDANLNADRHRKLVDEAISSMTRKGDA